MWECQQFLAFWLNFADTVWSKSVLLKIDGRGCTGDSPLYLSW